MLDVARRLRTRPVEPLDDFNSGLWGRFVDRVIYALIEAEQLIRNGKAPIDHLSKEGWWRTGTRPIAGNRVRLPAENSVTELLVRTLEDIRGRSDVYDLLRTQDVQFSQQVPRRSQRRIGSRALTTDIRAHSGALPDLDLRIEAKLLFGGGDLAAYCGRNGLLRFGDVDEPYTDGPMGMMLAYAVRHDRDSWKSRIARKVGGGVEMGSAGLPWFSHDALRPAGCTTVMHVALEFDTDPDARVLDRGRGPSKGYTRRARGTTSRSASG